MIHYTLYLILLSPFAPHIAEELWSSFAKATEDKQEKKKYQQSIFLQSWPVADERYLKDEEIEMVVQVNGKLRDRILVSPDITEDEAKKMTLESEKIKALIKNGEIKKIVFVQGKLINIVV